MPQQPQQVDSAGLGADPVINLASDPPLLDYLARRAKRLADRLLLQLGLRRRAEGSAESGAESAASARIP